MTNEPEVFEDQISRLELMASGSPTWDLSDNDCAAIRAALDRIKQLERGTTLDFGAIKLKIAIDLRCNGVACDVKTRGEGLDTSEIWAAAEKDGWTASADQHYCPKCSRIRAETGLESGTAYPAESA